MIHEFMYSDMDPEYRSTLFLARKKLLGSLESPTLLPDYGLNAQGVLNKNQYDRVQQIRRRRFAETLKSALEE